MTQKFGTREEAAKFMIDNPGVVLVDGVGDKVRWNCGGFEVLSSLNKWEYVCYLDPTPFTLPEPEKEELPFSKGFAATLKKECCATCTDNFFRALYRQFREWSKDEDEARARAVAIEEIEAAVACWEPGCQAYKLRRGAE
jgi:hypothetical protein